MHCQITELNRSKQSLEDKLDLTKATVVTITKELDEKDELLRRVEREAARREECLKQELEAAKLRGSELQQQLDKQLVQTIEEDNQVRI